MTQDYLESTVPPEKNVGKNAEIVFVFSEHTPENLQRIADEMITTGADIFAVEKIVPQTFGQGTYEEKQQMGQMLTDIIHGKSDADVATLTDDPLFRELVTRLKGTDRSIVFLDMGIDDPNFALYEEYQEAKELYSAVTGVDCSREDAALMYDYLVDTGARAYNHREAVMRRQLEQLAKQNPGKRIAVMVGASHSAMSYQPIEGATTSRTFVVSSIAADRRPGEIVRFDEHETMLRKRQRELATTVMKN